MSKNIMYTCIWFILAIWHYTVMCNVTVYNINFIICIKSYNTWTYNKLSKLSSFPIDILLHPIASYCILMHLFIASLFKIFTIGRTRWKDYEFCFDRKKKFEFASVLTYYNTHTAFCYVSRNYVCGVLAGVFFWQTRIYD